MAHRRKGWMARSSSVGFIVSQTATNKALGYHAAGASLTCSSDVGTANG